MSVAVHLWKDKKQNIEQYHDNCYSFILIYNNNLRVDCKLMNDI